MTADALGIPVNKGSNNEATLHGSAVGLLKAWTARYRGRETKAGGSLETIKPA